MLYFSSRINRFKVKQPTFPLVLISPGHPYSAEGYYYTPSQVQPILFESVGGAQAAGSESQALTVLEEEEVQDPLPTWTTLPVQRQPEQSAGRQKKPRGLRRRRSSS